MGSLVVFFVLLFFYRLSMGIRCVSAKPFCARELLSGAGPGATCKPGVKRGVSGVTVAFRS